MTNPTWWNDLDYDSRCDWLEDYISNETSISKKDCEHIYYAVSDELYLKILIMIFEDVEGLDVDVVYDNELEIKLEEQEANEA